MIERKGFFPTPKIVEIPVHGLSLGLEGLCILHLSDLHISTKTPHERVARLIHECNALSPDLIVITGDIIDCQAERIAEKLLLLKGLKAKTYFVSGNHDLFYGLDALKQILCGENIIYLDNRVIACEHHGTPFHLAGLGDRFSPFFGYRREISSVIADAREKNALIFLAHQPKDYTLALECHALLFLCGHTHGGQIFPFHLLVRLVQPFLNGLYVRGKMALYVSRGFGHWGIDLRFLAKSEMTLLRLKEAV